MSGKEKKEEKGGGGGRRHFLLSVLLFLHGDDVTATKKPRRSHDQATIKVGWIQPTKPARQAICISIVF